MESLNAPWVWEVLTIVVTAFLSAACTLGVVWWVYTRKLRPSLERELEEKIARLEDELGQLIRARVRQGVLDAVASLPSSNVLRETQKTMVRTASDLVEGGLAALWGEKPKKDPEED